MSSLNKLLYCVHHRKLSLSTNSIEKITNLNGLSEQCHHRAHNTHIYIWMEVWCCYDVLYCASPENLRILSLGRNNIKALTGLVSYIQYEAFFQRYAMIHMTLNYTFLHQLCTPPLPLLTLFLSFCVCVQEAVGDTLEELWISYNLIEKLKGIQCLKKLKVLYMSNNLVKDWGKIHS